MTFGGMISDLVGGLLVSVQIFAYTLLIALPLGFPIALGRMSKVCWISFSFSGRSSRGEYWISKVCIGLFSIIVLAVWYCVNPEAFVWKVCLRLLLLFFLGFLAIGDLALLVRRSRDIGCHGLWLAVLPVVEVMFYVARKGCQLYGSCWIVDYVQICVTCGLMIVIIGVGCVPGRLKSDVCCANQDAEDGGCFPLFRLSPIACGFISIMRGTPLMLQILFIYFAPYMFFGLPLSNYPRILATIIAFALNYAAYFAEIYRGGILSIDRGQHEAAAVLGFTKGQTFFRIVLPQVVKRVIPAVGNEVITLVKDTSLAFTIAVAEMFTIAKQLSSANTTMVPLVAAGVFYYVFNFLVAWSLERLERRLSYYD